MRPTLSRAAIAIPLTWCATATADDRVELELSYAAEAFAARGLERCCAALGVATAGVALDLDHVTAHVLRLYEAWLEHARDAWAIRAGILAVDQELVIAEHSTLLLNATFGIIGQLSANVIGPVA